MAKGLFLFFATAIFFASCKQPEVTGSGAEISEIRAIDPFTTLEIAAPIDAHIYIRPGAQPLVKLTGYKNVLQYIRTDMDGKTLYIHSKDETNIHTDKKIIAEITVPSIAVLSLSGATHADVHGDVTGDDFRVRISGVAEVVVDSVHVDNIHGNITGAGNVTIKSGTVTYAEYRISGAGDINAFPLQSEETISLITGTGNSDVSVSRKLHVHISGLGNVRYKGHPILSSETTGIGGVSDAN